MSELSENWKNLKRDIGAFTGKINSLVDRYEPLADVEEKAYKRGYDKGYQEAMAKTKADICNGCNHKALAKSDKKTLDSIVYQINPCRHCNNTEAVELLDIDKVLYWVSCARCGRGTKPYTKKRNAIKAWNRSNKLDEVEK